MSYIRMHLQARTHFSGCRVHDR